MILNTPASPTIPTRSPADQTDHASLSITPLSAICVRTARADFADAFGAMTNRITETAEQVKQNIP
jgi:hypothetical protein